jgi:hypothetical protein
LSEAKGVHALFRDAQIASHVLGLHSEGDAPKTTASCPGPPPQYQHSSQQHWPVDRVKRYIAWTKAAFKPGLSHPAQELVLAYYRKQRHLASLMHCTGDRVTVRFLESLVRLSQAHARLMARSQVELLDAAAAILLVDTCAHVSSLLNLRYHAKPHCICELNDDELAKATEHLLQVLGISRLYPLARPPSPEALPAPDSDEARTKATEGNLFAYAHARPRATGEALSAPDVQGSEVKEEPAPAHALARLRAASEGVPATAHARLGVAAGLLPATVCAREGSALVRIDRKPLVVQDTALQRRAPRASSCGLPLSIQGTRRNAVRRDAAHESDANPAAAPSVVPSSRCCNSGQAMNSHRLWPCSSGAGGSHLPQHTSRHEMEVAGGPPLPSGGKFAKVCMSGVDMARPTKRVCSSQGCPSSLHALRDTQVQQSLSNEPESKLQMPIGVCSRHDSVDDDVDIGELDHG